ncbi:membrane protein [Caldimicrobium thiodismutans]|uniref:Probable membrane transporter protein n=1 Tax=Caldimicrobium thiodismutans TaxID=1653476 RepID=A0A0U5AXT9_9BACT|nr:sulfite exporter TauE/SafE family protein [Caldimicrobium thiodismutans]BAU23263.1 membrane protein [Caldimicrobium thiodismutans]
MQEVVQQAVQMIDLQLWHIIYLVFVGFVGGLVSGFIGSGGAFVLTPSMMSMGVPGIVAVASNMCHKFPKALVGAIKRAKFGHVDVKLGIVMGASAEAGVLFGAHVQEYIKRTLGDAGSSLYVSVAFIIVLSTVGLYVLKDAFKSMALEKQGQGSVAEEEKPTRIAQFLYKLNIPGTMLYFKSINQRISFLFTIPLGFATGFLAATIAVGGFIGVPSMMYILGVPSLLASGTELVIAFVMGAIGSFKYAWSGFVDIRLAMLILLGSLFGVQLGAIGTTYVKGYMIKFVMGTIMLIILLSRSLMLPVYLSKLGWIAPLDASIVSLLKSASFVVNAIALLVAAFIIFKSLIKGIYEEKRLRVLETSASSIKTK